jgi:hypothetical protein
MIKILRIPYRGGQLLQSLTTLSSQENMQDIDYQQNFLGFCGVLLQFCTPHTVPNIQN